MKAQTVNAHFYQPPSFSPHRAPASVRNLSTSTQNPLKRLPNGALVLNISAPACGVSYNLCQLPSTNIRSIVFNNAQYPSHIRLGAFTRGNPRLALTGPARIIILHTQEALPLRLQGCLEVAGVQAEVVIANPQGITCQISHFINTQRVILTTGKPIINEQRELKGYHITQGAIRIDAPIENKTSDQLNWSNLEQIDLFARTAKLNTAVKIECLHVLTGRYKVAHTGPGTVLPLVKPFSNNTFDMPFPRVAIDITPRAYIDVRNIQIIGNEESFSIKSAGNLQTESLTLKNPGAVTLSGAIKAKNADISAQGTLIQEGHIESTGYFKLESQKQLIHTGTVQSQTLKLNAPLLEFKGPLQAQDSLLFESDQCDIEGSSLAAGRLLHGRIQKRLISTVDWRVGFPNESSEVPGQLKIESKGPVQSKGIHQSSGSIDIKGSKLHLNDSIISSRGQLTLEADTDNIHLNSAEIQGQRVILKTPLTLYH